MFNYKLFLFYEYQYRFGPLIHHWTARFESKHRYLKQLATRLGNFKNLAFTLATRHQSYQCYLMRENALGSESLEMGPGIYMERIKPSVSCGYV